MELIGYEREDVQQHELDIPTEVVVGFVTEIFRTPTSRWRLIREEALAIQIPGEEAFFCVRDWWIATSGRVGQITDHVQEVLHF